jgi:hypothetical protein
MPRVRIIDEGSPEDTEGNMPFKRVDAGDETGDTEGNMPIKRGAVTGEEATDDAEGNAIRSGRVAKAGRSEGDDTEGNGIRSGRSAPNDARPNRGVRPRI